MLTNDKMTALRKLLSRVLKANFSADELEIMRMNGITISDVMDRGYFEEASIAEAQKTSIALMSRRPLDDFNDLIIWYAKGTTGDIVFRCTLGIAGKDGIVEKLADLPQSIVTTVADWLSSAGLNAKSNDRMAVDPIDNKILSGSDYNSDNLERADVITTIGTDPVNFIKIVSQEGRPNWNDI